MPLECELWSRSSSISREWEWGEMQTLRPTSDFLKNWPFNKTPGRCVCTVQFKKCQCWMNCEWQRLAVEEGSRWELAWFQEMLRAGTEQGREQMHRAQYLT